MSGRLFFMTHMSYVDKIFWKQGLPGRWGVFAMTGKNQCSCGFAGFRHMQEISNVDKLKNWQHFCQHRKPSVYAGFTSNVDKKGMLTLFQKLFIYARVRTRVRVYII